MEPAGDDMTIDDADLAAPAMPCARLGLPKASAARHPHRGSRPRGSCSALASGVPGPPFSDSDARAGGRRDRSVESRTGAAPPRAGDSDGDVLDNGAGSSTAVAPPRPNHRAARRPGVQLRRPSAGGVEPGEVGPLQRPLQRRTSRDSPPRWVFF
jgi:hypothetical protein